MLVGIRPDETVEGFWSILRRVFAKLSDRRRKQLFALMALMLLGAIAEMATLGTIVPFLAFVASPETALSNEWVSIVYKAFGWTDYNQAVQTATLLFGAVVVLAAACRLLLMWVSQKFVFGVGHDLAMGALQRVLVQPLAFHKALHSSNTIAVINKSQLVVQGVFLPLMQATIALVIAAALLAALFVIDAGIVFTAIAVLLFVYSFVGLTNRRILRQNSLVISHSQTARIRVMQEALGGIRDILLSGLQAQRLRQFSIADSAVRDARTMNTFLGASPRYVIEACSVLFIAGFALFLSNKPDGLNAALPTLGALALGGQKLMISANAIFNGWVQVKGNQRSLIDVLQLMDLSDPSEQDYADSSALTGLTSEIRLRDVSFTYQATDHMVIDETNVVIKRGDRVAIIGETGSGKSTVVDLIAGLLEPSSGTIEIDDRPLGPANIRLWQSRIAYVPQDIFLIDASLIENITYTGSDIEPDLHRVRNAVHAANLSKLVERLPQGLSSFTGENGIQLSGGQRQRLGIARALYKEADLLILDEATSALDIETEEKILNALNEIGREVTLIVVSHRLRNESFFDKIFQVKDATMVRVCDE